MVVTITVFQLCNISSVVFMNFSVLDFKLSPCSECCMLSFGLFPGVWILYTDVSEHSVCSEMSAYKIQTPGNDPKESIQHNFSVILPFIDYTFITNLMPW